VSFLQQHIPPTSINKTYRRICALSQLLELLEATGVALVHGFYPASSAERAHANVAVGPLAGERSYSKGADVGWVQVDLQRFLPGEFGVPEDFARGRQQRGDAQGRGRGEESRVGVGVWFGWRRRRLKGVGLVVATHRTLRGDLQGWRVGKMGVEQRRAADWRLRSVWTRDADSFEV
jgi:hypothetical protein